MPAWFFGVTRGEILAVVAVLSVLNAGVPMMLDALHTESPLQFLASGMGIDWIVWIALGIAVWLALCAPPSSASASELAIAGLCASLIFIPVPDLAGLAATIMAAYLLASPKGGTELKAGAFVLLALAAQMLWTKIMVRMFGVTFIDLDAALVGAITHLAVTDNIIPFTRGGGHFVIAQPCTSVHNVSFALLLFVALTRALRPRPALAEWGYAAAIFATVFVINTLRLTLMSKSPADFHYWHGYDGAVLVSIAMMATTLFWTALGARRELAR